MSQSTIFMPFFAAVLRVVVQLNCSGPGNRFWDILERAKITTLRRLDPMEYRVLFSYGIGITDMAKSFSGSDTEIPSTADNPAGLREKLIRLKPRSPAFVRKRAAKI